MACLRRTSSCPLRSHEKVYVPSKGSAAVTQSGKPAAETCAKADWTAHRQKGKLTNFCSLRCAFQFNLPRW